MECGGDNLTYSIIGAAFEVHRQLGHGFLEAVYHEALAIEFGIRNIPFQSEVALPVEYRNIVLNCHYRVDFLCYGKIIVELKALDSITGIEEAQVINYLNASGFEVALLLNFGQPSMEHKRLILSSNKSVNNPQIPQIHTD